MPLVKSTSIKRLPELGHLNIQDFNKFLEKSKIEFEGRWVKDITYKDVLDDFDLLKLLGTGSFGDVVLVKYLKNDCYYALKTIEKEKVVKYNQLKNLKNEKKVLQCINFPFTIHLHSCFQDKNYIYFLMPYVPLELFKLLSACREFNEDEAMFYVSQVILALEYLHYLDIIYRDLKPENILIDEGGYVKLADFGFCKRLSGKRTYTVCGTPEFIALEIFLQKGYGLAVDWWGCGVLAYELVAGITPFHGENHSQIYAKVILCNYKVPKKFSVELIDLLNNLLTKDLTRRLGNLKNGSSDIKNHKWFRTVNWMAVLNRTVRVPYKPIITEENISDMWTPVKSSLKNDYSDMFQDF